MKKLILVLGLLATGFTHADTTLIDSVDLNCKGLRDVVLRTDGVLTINGKDFQMNGHSGNTMFFDNKVKLVGEVEGDTLYFDKSRIVYGGQTFNCSVE